jgi:starvation-inducible DNA-binding protein
MQLKTSTSSSNIQIKSHQPILKQHIQGIQPIGTFWNLPIEVTVTHCESCEILNQILAGSIILYSLYKKNYRLIHSNILLCISLQLNQHGVEQLRLIDLLGEYIQTMSNITMHIPYYGAEVTEIQHPPHGTGNIQFQLCSHVC